MLRFYLPFNVWVHFRPHKREKKGNRILYTDVFEASKMTDNRLAQSVTWKTSSLYESGNLLLSLSYFMCYIRFYSLSQSTKSKMPLVNRQSFINWPLTLSMKQPHELEEGQDEAKHETIETSKRDWRLITTRSVNGFERGHRVASIIHLCWFLIVTSSVGCKVRILAMDIVFCTKICESWQKRERPSIEQEIELTNHRAAFRHTL